MVLDEAAEGSDDDNEEVVNDVNAAENAVADESLDDIDFGAPDTPVRAGVSNASLDDIKDDMAKLQEQVDSRFHKPQRAFQPSSTPLSLSTDEDGRITADPRYLCWNYKGVATSRYVRGSVVLDVEYDDANGDKRSLTVPSDTGKPFIVGSLGDQGGIFASDLMDDDDEDMSDDEDMQGVSAALKNELKKEKTQKRREARAKNAKEGQYGGSDVYFHRFDTFGPSATKDWKVTLPRDEVVVAAATGMLWSAVVTSRRFLRLYTNGGMQDEVIWLKGEPVTVVGKGR